MCIAMGRIHHIEITGSGEGRRSQDSIESEVVVDYRAGAGRPALAVLVACDGAGSIKRSEVGSFIVARIVAQNVNRYLCDMFDDRAGEEDVEGNEPAPIAADVIDGVLESALRGTHSLLGALAQMTQKTHDWMPTTIVLAVVGEGYARAWMVGDGVVGAHVEGGDTQVNTALTSQIMGGKAAGMKPASSQVVVEEPANGCYLAFTAEDACRTHADRFWVPVLKVDGGEIRHVFVSSDGLRHAEALRGIANGATKATIEALDSARDRDVEARKEAAGYVDDLGMVWWMC